MKTIKLLQKILGISAIFFTFSIPLRAAQVTVQIQGMSCGVCIETIINQLKKTQKLENIVVDLSSQKTTFSEKIFIPDSEIKKVIEQAGYQVIKISRTK